MPRRRSRKTVGYNGPIFVAKAIAYTTDATIAAFQANAPVGEIGVFDANDALHDNAITATESFYVAMKMTNGIKRTPLYKKSETAAYKKAYVAPVKQITAVGWTGTTGSLSLGTVLSGDQYLLKVIETTEGNDPYPTWNYEVEAKSGDDQMDIAQKLAKKINNPLSKEHLQNERLVSAKVQADATYGNYAVGTGGTLVLTQYSDVVNNTDTIDVAKGDFISFDASAAPTDAIGDIYEIIEIIDATHFRLNRPFQGATVTYNEAQAEGTRVKKVTTVVEVGIELTCLDFETHFKVAVSGNLIDAAVTTETAFVAGNGTYQKVLDAEIEGETWEGDTTKNVAFAADYGQQDRFSVSGETYDAYHLPVRKVIAGIAPQSEFAGTNHITIFVAKSTGDVDSTLDTLFAL